MEWMPCTTCNRVVKINNTGICLGCQRGFTGMDAEDVWKPSPVEAAKATEVNRLESRKKEIEDALKEVSKQEGDIGEHKDGDGARQAPKTSRRDSLKRRKKS